MLGGDLHADAVRADEDEARALGIRAVPFFAVDGRYGVSGAQPADVLHRVLARRWEEAAAGRDPRGRRVRPRGLPLTPPRS